MTLPAADPGSFRDPGGQVFLAGDRVFRTVKPTATEDFDYVQSTGLMEHLTDRGLALEAALASPDALGDLAKGACYTLEHPKLPFVSYPYEWPFSALKAAALCHLDVHLAALERGVTLSDATAYNIQFNGARAVFIDRLSFVRYREGEFWAGHRQFTEQFLNPLLLRALFGVSHNAWYRGAQEGISALDLRRLLKLRHKLSWNVLVHVVLQSAFQSSVTRNEAASHGEAMTRVGLPRPAFERMLRKLRSWIATLEPADTGKTVWQDYAKQTSYDDQETAAKRRFIAEFASANAPRLLWDLGCNSGDFAEAALQAGARYAVGFDYDQGALEAAFGRATSRDLPLQTLFLDVANPASDQGWAERERKGLGARADADAILALALVHHLAIGRNVPLDRLVAWLVDLAPSGVIEFVPKSDPMVAELLRFRRDIFPDYTEDSFLALVSARARLVRSDRVTDSGRLLVWYDRK